MSEKRPPGGTRSTFGPHPTRSSAPVYGFPQCTRATQDKVFISQEHAELVLDSCSPGPVYTVVPAIGPQVNGAMVSAPLYGFGASTREVANKVFISHEHSEKTNSTTTPGPIYATKPAIGPQSDGAIANAPCYGFGTSNRDHQAKVYVSAEHNVINDFGKGSPGPAAPYKLRPCIGGSTVHSSGPSPYATGGGRGVRNASQPAWVMGKAERFARDKAADTAGPGQYTIVPAVGPQVNGRLKSAPLYGFGTSNRDHMEKVFISHEHEKTSGGRDAPGPGAYAIKSLTGNPVRAGKEVTGPRWGFGTGKRFTDEFKHQQGNPGPGQYVI